MREPKSRSRFMKAVNDKRLMVPVTVILAVCVVALTVLLALDSTGALYGILPDKDNKPSSDGSSAGDRTLADKEPIKSGDYQYRLYTDGTAELYFYEVNKATEVVVPSEIDGHKVTAIGDECFVWMAFLTDVTIPDGVTYIGVEAFSGCGNLLNLRLPSSLTHIAANAFLGCSNAMRVEYAGDISSVTVGEGNSALLSAIEASR